MDAVQTMFSVREVPWHGKGNIPGHYLTASEALKQGGLDWKVELFPISVGGVEIPDQYAVMRMDVYNESPSMESAVENGAIMAVVGSRYVPIQNKDLFTFFDPVVAREEGAFYETGGVLFGGRRVWLLAKVPGDFYVPGVEDDLLKRYILLASSHDGSLPLTIKAIWTRVVCNNTLSFALKEPASAIRIMHTDTAKHQIAVAHTFFGLATQETGIFKEAAEKLLDIKVTPKFLKGFLKKLIKSKPEEEGEDPSTYAINQRERVEILFAGADTNTLPGMKGTGWALYNAVAEYVDHEKPSRSEPLNRSWFGSGEDMKKKAFRLLMEHHYGKGWEAE